MIDMNQKFINELHLAICQHFQAEYGGLVSKLESWRFNYVETATIPRLKRVIDKYDPDSKNESLVSDTFSELVTKGYLEEKDWGFCLTEKGYLEGTQSIYRKVIVYFNENPGWAIVVSIIALIVSVAALYVVYTKP